MLLCYLDTSSGKQATSVQLREGGKEHFAVVVYALHLLILVR